MEKIEEGYFKGYFKYEKLNGKGRIIYPDGSW